MRKRIIKTPSRVSLFFCRHNNSCCCNETKETGLDFQKFSLLLISLLEYRHFQDFPFDFNHPDTENVPFEHPIFQLFHKTTFFLKFNKKQFIMPTKKEYVSLEKNTDLALIGRALSHELRIEILAISCQEQTPLESARLVLLEPRATQNPF